MHCSICLELGPQNLEGDINVRIRIAESLDSSIKSQDRSTSTSTPTCGMSPMKWSLITDGPHRDIEGVLEISAERLLPFVTFPKFGTCD